MDSERAFKVQWIQIDRLQLKRAMLLIGGPDLKWNPMIDDDNPPKFYEPLSNG